MTGAGGRITGRRMPRGWCHLRFHFRLPPRGRHGLGNGARHPGIHPRCPPSADDRHPHRPV